MSVSFLNPKGLRNLSGSSICSKFSNNDPANLHLLASGSCNLDNNGLYSSSNCTGCSPTTYGFYIPKVADQGELDDNFEIIIGSEATNYLFFKVNEDAEWVLHMSTDLGTGFDEGTPVEAYLNEVKVGYVTDANVSTAVITARDGGIIIIGVLDTLGEER